MSNKRISELNLHTEYILSDVIPIVSSNETKKTTYGSLYYAIRNGLVSGSTQIKLENTSYTDNGDKSFLQTDGNGNLSFQYVDSVFESFYAGQSLPKGTPLYLSGSVGANPIAYAADASDPNKMPVTLIAVENIIQGNTYKGNVLGLINGIDLTGYIAGQTVYVAEGGGWTTNLPSGSNSITQVLGIVTKSGNGGKGLVLNPGPAQLPGLRSGNLWVGDSNNRPTTQSIQTLATTGSNYFNGNQSITGSVNISSILNLKPLNSLPTGRIGDLAVSGSNLYFYNGSWNIII